MLEGSGLHFGAAAEQRCPTAAGPFWQTATLYKQGDGWRAKEFTLKVQVVQEGGDGATWRGAAIKLFSTAEAKQAQMPSTDVHRLFNVSHPWLLAACKGHLRMPVGRLYRLSKTAAITAAGKAQFGAERAQTVAKAKLDFSQ